MLRSSLFEQDLSGGNSDLLWGHPIGQSHGEARWWDVPTESNQRQPFPTCRRLAATPVPKATFNAKVSTGTFLPEPTIIWGGCASITGQILNGWILMIFVDVVHYFSGCHSLNSWSVRAHSFTSKPTVLNIFVVISCFKMHILNSCSWALPFATTSMFMCWRFVNGCYICQPITLAFSTGWCAVGENVYVRGVVFAMSFTMHCVVGKFVWLHNMWTALIEISPFLKPQRHNSQIDCSFYKGHDQATDSCPQTCPSKLHRVYLCSGMVITCPHEEDLACHGLS